MGSPAYATEIYTKGISTPIVDEPTTELDPVRFQITDPTKRLLDPLMPVTSAQGDIVHVDYFQGIITFAATGATGVLVSGSYLPVQFIAGSNSYSIELAGDILESTPMGLPNNGGYRQRIYGLHETTVNVDRYDDLARDFKQWKNDSEQVYIKIVDSAKSVSYEGWYVTETANSSGDIGAVESESLAFTLASLPTIQGYAFTVTDL